VGQTARLDGSRRAAGFARPALSRTRDYEFCIAESRKTFSEDLEENFRRYPRIAALLDELDGAVEVHVAPRDALCQMDRVARLDQHVQPPAGDSLTFGLVLFCDLGHCGGGLSA
jgi:hypothetical protein